MPPRLCVAPIVEGHGEAEAIRILLQRIWTELLNGEYIDVLRPIRRPRGKLVKPQELGRAVQLAAGKLAEARTTEDPTLILILLDADDDLPCEKGPELLRFAEQARSDVDIACVLANVEYETWFVASAESLNLCPEGQSPKDPEAQRSGKHWVAERYGQYSPTVDQPSLTARMDLTACRRRSPSFDKLCREFEKRLHR